MDGCLSLTDLNLNECKKLTADGLIGFFSHPPPMLQKLDLSETSLQSKCRQFHVAPMLQLT